MPGRKSVSKQLRLRVFAGPNGSGKSTIVGAVKSSIVEGKPIDFGFYINADDITQALLKRRFSFSRFRLKLDSESFNSFAKFSGLLDEDFDFPTFSKSFLLKGSRIYLLNINFADRIGQIIARYLREEMLRLKRRFSFETVFSHKSNIDIMRRAKEQGYKVYLYFVSTESPEINKYRVALRVKQGGHSVPPDKIESRYYKASKLMHRAADLAYQAFFFDNSKEDEPFTLVAHFKLKSDTKIWDTISKSKQAIWFQKYYC